MGLFGKSDKEKEQEDIARQNEARRKLDEARKRQAQQAPATTPATPAAKAAAAAAASPAGRAQATPVSAPAGQGEFETYTVAKGDSLSKIAKHHLGDANAWRKIYDANREVIGKDPDKIFPGQQLRIPRQKGTQTA
jgi:nucleoid-associated protein YgaU